MGSGSPTRLRRTLGVVTVAVLGLAAPAHAGDLLVAPAAAPAVEAVAPAAEALATNILPAVEAPAEPQTLPALEDAGNPLARNDVVRSLPPVPRVQQTAEVAPRSLRTPTLHPDAPSSGGAEGDPVLRPGIGGFADDASNPRPPHRAKAAAVPRRRESVQPPVRVAAKVPAAQHVLRKGPPIGTVAGRPTPAAAPAEPAASGNPGEPAAAGSGNGSGTVGALLLAAIVLAFVQLGLRLVAVNVTPRGIPSLLQLGRPG
jgi:hypothetical protein